MLPTMLDSELENVGETPFERLRVSIHWDSRSRIRFFNSEKNQEISDRDFSIVSHVPSHGCHCHRKVGTNGSRCNFVVI